MTTPYFEAENVSLFLGDALAVLPTLEAGSVDCVITDLPYGLTACAWDSVIPFAPMWEQIKRVVKPNAAVVLFGQQPFASALIMSNAAQFKYEWIWDTVMTSNFANAKRMPLRRHQNIMVFGNGKLTYNPQFQRASKPFGKITRPGAECYGDLGVERNFEVGYPQSIQCVPRPNNLTGDGGLHPTQKPVALLRYLVQTYTNEGDTVLDFTMGSGTCGVACIETGRRFIGIERDADYCKIAAKRLRAAMAQGRLFDSDSTAPQPKLQPTLCLPLTLPLSGNADKE